MITIIKTGKQTNLHYKSNKKGTLYKVFTNAIKAHMHAHISPVK